MKHTPAFSPALLAKASSIVRRRTGLVFAEPRKSALTAGLAAGLRRSGSAAAEEYVERLAGDTELLDDLVVEITVGETYFFRDPGQFSVVRDRILPDLRAHGAADRALRAWSAGCATGEEAYSLAILMQEQQQAARIIGTDISRAALEKARAAVYGKWSLRGVPETIVQQHFRYVRGRFELERAVRDAVEFQHLNLAEAGWPSHSLGIADMDLILCRNVLIYFDSATILRVAARLIDSLSEQGWLLMGASDPPLRELVSCEVVMMDSGLAYRRLNGRSKSSPPRPAETAVTRRPKAGKAAATWRDEVAQQAAVPPAPRSRPADSHRVHEPVAPPQYAELYRMRRYDEAAAQAVEHVERDRSDLSAWIVLVRSHANRGELHAADSACLAALKYHPMSAELEYLHSVLLTEAGRSSDAVKALRRALYIDRTLIVAHVALGQLLSSAGDREGARRAFANAEQLLVDLPQDAVVAAADGETAARLLSITRAQAALVNGSAS